MIILEHNHDFIEYFKSIASALIVRPGVSIIHNVEGGQEQEQLNLQEGEVIEDGWDGHKNQSSQGEDREIIDIGAVSEQMDF